MKRRLGVVGSQSLCAGSIQCPRLPGECTYRAQSVTERWWMRGNEVVQCSCRSSPTPMSPSGLVGFFSGTPDPISDWPNQTFRKSGTHVRYIMCSVFSFAKFLSGLLTNGAAGPRISFDPPCLAFDPLSQHDRTFPDFQSAGPHARTLRPSRRLGPVSDILHETQRSFFRRPDSR